MQYILDSTTRAIYVLGQQNEHNLRIWKVLTVCLPFLGLVLVEPMHVIHYFLGINDSLMNKSEKLRTIIA